MTASNNQPVSEPPQFSRGDLVTVRVDNPGGHFRTPTYIQGHTGRVEALCGIFPNPESLAYGGTGQPHQPLYRVEFSQPQVWPAYAGLPGDKILVDIYQHWLVSAFA